MVDNPRQLTHKKMHSQCPFHGLERNSDILLSVIQWSFPLTGILRSNYLIEVKNELTGNSTDPYIQVPFLYKNYPSTLSVDILSRTVCPVMVLLIFGTYVSDC